MVLRLTRHVHEPCPLNSYGVNLGVRVSSAFDTQLALDNEVGQFGREPFKKLVGATVWSNLQRISDITFVPSTAKPATLGSYQANVYDPAVRDT